MLGLGHGINTDTCGTGEVFHNDYSIYFAGDDDYINLDSTLGPDIDSTSGTISAWVKLETVSASGQILSCRRDSQNLIQLFYHASSNEMRATHKGNNTSKYAKIAAGETIENSGNWHNIAMTWDTSEGEVKIYLDGTLKQTTTGIQAFSGAAPNVCRIGESSATGSGYWKGHMDEISVFDEVVSISTLYNEGKPKDVEFSDLDGLIGYYRFTEGTGTSIGDESGNGNTGTLVNGASFNDTTP